SRSDTTTRSVARRVRPQAESILHDPPIQKKAPFGAFSVSVSPTSLFFVFFLYSPRAEIRMVIILAA
ncbi:hypothetical protein, partial [Serratia bockelmannii]|uniref:hypothetical protein n=1 Tax=Serratia bockelmannii TaxID=2703793 RepID=UPI00313DC2DA